MSETKYHVPTTFKPPARRCSYNSSHRIHRKICFGPDLGCSQNPIHIRAGSPDSPRSHMTSCHIEHGEVGEKKVEQKHPSPDGWDCYQRSYDFFPTWVGGKQLLNSSLRFHKWTGSTNSTRTAGSGSTWVGSTNSTRTAGSGVKSENANLISAWHFLTSLDPRNSEWPSKTDSGFQLQPILPRPGMDNWPIISTRCLTIYHISLTIKVLPFMVDNEVNEPL